MNAKVKHNAHQPAGYPATLLFLLFCFLFFAAGIGTFWIGLGEPLLNVARAQFWKEVPCTILSSSVKGVKTFRVAIEYEYEIENQRRVGNRYSFFSGATSGRLSKRKIVDQHPVGAQSVCYVNPHDVSESVLNRRFQLSMLWGLIGIPLAAGGGTVAYAIMREQRKRHQEGSELNSQTSENESSTPRGRITVHDESYTHHALADTAEPITLKSSTSRLSVFFSLLLITLLWNGCVGFVLFGVVTKMLRGNTDWGMLIVMGLFQLIGLGLILATLYRFLMLFNPLPVLVLHRSVMPLGSEGQLNWKFKGSPRAIQNLKLSLHSYERVTYVQGTNTKSEEHILFDELLFSTTEPQEIETGELIIRIPADAMHSFDARNNQVIWRLQVFGQLRFWPDVNEAFPIRVVPHE